MTVAVRTRVRRTAVRRAEVHLALALLVTGCGGTDAPAAPEVPPPPPPPVTPPTPPPAGDSLVVLRQAAIPASGGTVVVNREGHPLHGLTIVLPAEAYPVGTSWTVTAQPTSRPTLPEGLRQVGTAFRVQNNQGYARVPFSLTIPVPEATRANAVAFLHDPSSGTFELLPLLGATPSGIQVVTRHLSADQMLRIGNRRALGRDAVTAGIPQAQVELFGQVEIVVLEVDPLTLGGTIVSSFVQGVHDWEFVNNGSWLTPLGFCTGSTLSALYHHYTRDAAPLFRQYRKHGGNAQGIRLASEIQHTMNWPGADRQIFNILQAATTTGMTSARTQALALGASLRLTGLPQQLAVYPESLSDGGHAVIATGMDARSFQIADPSQPGVRRSIEFAGDAWVPFDFSDRADLPPDPYVQAFVIGATALVPLSTFESHWEAFLDGTAGDRYFPPYRMEYREPLLDSTTWLPVGDSIRTAFERIDIRTICPNCEIGGRESYMDQAVFVDSGQIRPVGSTGSRNGLPIDLTVGREEFRIRLSSFTTSENYGFVDRVSKPIHRVEFALAADQTVVQAGTAVTLSLAHGGLYTPGRRLRWRVGDGSPDREASGPPEITHTYDSSGAFVARVELLADNGRVIALDSLTISVLTFALDRDSIELRDSSLLRLSATVTAPPSDGFRIEWDWGDGQPRTLTTDTSVADHLYRRVDRFTVIARLRTRDDSVRVVAMDSATVVTRPLPFWVLTSLTDASGYALAQTGQQDVILSSLIADPGRGVFALRDLEWETISRFTLWLRLPGRFADQSCCRRSAAASIGGLLSGGATAAGYTMGDNPATEWNLGPAFSAFRTTSWSQSTPDLTTGTMSALHLFATRVYRLSDEESQVGPQRTVRITNAVRDGDRLTGVLELHLFQDRNADGHLINIGVPSYVFPFTARRMF